MLGGAVDSIGARASLKVDDDVACQSSSESRAWFGVCHVNHRIRGLRANGLVCHWHVLAHGIWGLRASGFVLSLARCRSTVIVVLFVLSVRSRVESTS